MIAQTFSSLSIHDKAALLWDKGVYLETVSYYGYRVNLYTLFNFFVEIFYNPGTNSIEKIQVADQSDLKKYLSSIKIDTF